MSNVRQLAINPIPSNKWRNYYMAFNWLYMNEYYCLLLYLLIIWELNNINNIENALQKEANTSSSPTQLAQLQSILHKCSNTKHQLTCFGSGLPHSFVQNRCIGQYWRNDSWPLGRVWECSQLQNTCIKHRKNRRRFQH